MKKFFQGLWPLNKPSSKEFGATKNPTSSNTISYQPDDNGFNHPPPPNNTLPTLPAEIHLHILEFTDWRDHPNLGCVCKLWRHFLKTSPTILKSHYENYNRFYEEVWQTSLLLKNRPRPHLHKVVEHLETFVRGWDGSFRPGNIQLKDPRDRWGGYWDFSNGTAKWINPKCKLVQPFDYGIFKDDPIVRYSKGEGDKVEIRVVETSYSSKDVHRVNGKPFRFDMMNMTVGDYIRELASAINFEETLVEYQRPAGESLSGRSRRGSAKDVEPPSNVVWVSTYATLLAAVGIRFVIKAIYYETETAIDSFVY
ncbi:hypothetical protein TWF281_009696 [Arthrobotrys megalospora]